MHFYWESLFSLWSERRTKWMRLKQQKTQQTMSNQLFTTTCRRESRVWTDQRLELNSSRLHFQESLSTTILTLLSHNSWKVLSAGFRQTHRTCQRIVSSCSRVVKPPPERLGAFEGTRVLKRDRTTHKSITLIEADKNTNCALLNCWHWTGRIRTRILTTGDGCREQWTRRVGDLDAHGLGVEREMNKCMTSPSSHLH